MQNEYGRERSRRARELEVERVAFKAEQDFNPENERKCEHCFGNGTLPPLTTPSGVFLRNGKECAHCVGTGRRLGKRERAQKIEDWRARLDIRKQRWGNVDE